MALEDNRMFISIALVLYALAVLALALFSWKKDSTMEDFLVAGRNQKKLLVTASMLASTIGGGITIGTVQRASTMGFPAFWFVAAGGFAHFLQGYFLSRKVRDSRALTMAEMADTMAGSSARILTSIIVLITWVGIAAAQFVAVARVMNSLVGMNHGTSVVVAAAFITIYTLIGGQKSVLRTDLFQFGIMAASIIAALAWLFLATPPPQGSIKIDLFTQSFGPLDLIYYMVVMGGSYFICPMMFSRILTADTAENARKSSFMSGTGMLLFAFALTFIGLWVSATGFDSGKQDPLNAIASLALPRVLGVLLIFGLLSAIISTADTVLLTASSIIQNDLIRKPSVPMVRFWTVAVGFVAAAVAFNHTDVIGLLMKTYNGYTAGLVPALFVAIMAGRKPSRAWLLATGIVAGYILGMAGSLNVEIGAFLSLGKPTAAGLGKVLPLAGMAVSAVLALGAYAQAPAKR